MILILLMDQYLFSPTIMKNVFSVVLQFSQHLAAFESNTSNWLYHTVDPIRSYISVKFTKFWRKRPGMLMNADTVYKDKIKENL